MYHSLEWSDLSYYKSIDFFDVVWMQGYDDIPALNLRIFIGNTADINYVWKKENSTKAKNKFLER